MGRGSDVASLTLILRSRRIVSILPAAALLSLVPLSFDRGEADVLFSLDLTVNIWAYLPYMYGSLVAIVVPSPLPELEMTTPRRPLLLVKGLTLVGLLVSGLGIILSASAQLGADATPWMLRNMAWAFGLALLAGVTLGELLGWAPLTVLGIVSYLFGQTIDAKPRQWNLALQPVNGMTVLVSGVVLVLGSLLFMHPRICHTWFHLGISESIRAS